MPRAEWTGRFKRTVHSRLKVTSSVIPSILRDDLAGSEQGSDLLSAGMHPESFKTRTPTGEKYIWLSLFIFDR